MIYPERLNSGDRIAIISPATTVKEEYIDGAVRLLREEGFDPVVFPHAKGPASGSFASSEECRLADLKSALHDPSVKAILCARGGYGCVHLLPHFTDTEIRDNPKWLIGFSDVSALHALWQRAGVASLHAPMAKHLTLEGRDDVCTRQLIGILKGETVMAYHAPSRPFNRQGIAEGCLVGGNLAVLNGLAGTDVDLLSLRCDEGVVLFIEDISEAIYAVERMLMRLSLSGALHRIKGLIVGQFTEYRPDKNFESMEEMVDSLLKRRGVTGVPVAFNFPVGHVALNYPLIEGAMVRLSVSSGGVALQSITE